MSRSLTHYKFIFVQDRRQDSLSFLSMKQDIAYPRLAANSLRSTGWPWTFGSSFWVLDRGCTALCRFREVPGLWPRLSVYRRPCYLLFHYFYTLTSSSPSIICHFHFPRQCMFLTLLSKINWLELCSFSSAIFLFLCALFLRQHNAVLVSGICMYFEIRFVIPTTWLFLVRTALVV